MFGFELKFSIARSTMLVSISFNRRINTEQGVLKGFMTSLEYLESRSRWIYGVRFYLRIKHYVQWQLELLIVYRVNCLKICCCLSYFDENLLHMTLLMQKPETRARYKLQYVLLIESSIKKLIWNTYKWVVYKSDFAIIRVRILYYFVLSLPCFLKYIKLNDLMIKANSYKYDLDGRPLLIEDHRKLPLSKPLYEHMDFEKNYNYYHIMGHEEPHL